MGSTGDEDMSWCLQTGCRFSLSFELFPLNSEHLKLSSLINQLDRNGHSTCELYWNMGYSFMCPAER